MSEWFFQFFGERNPSHLFLKETAEGPYFKRGRALLLKIDMCERRLVRATAFSDRVEPHRRTLRLYALRLCGNPADADDLVQETVTRALANEVRLLDTDAVGPWLAVTLYRLFIDQCRRRKAESAAHEGIRHLVPAATSDQPTQLPKWMRVSDDDVRSAVAALPSKLRKPYLLRAQGRSYKEIAEELELTVNTVSTHIRRARHRLKESLSKGLSS